MVALACVVLIATALALSSLSIGHPERTVFCRACLSVSNGLCLSVDLRPTP